MKKIHFESSLPITNPAINGPTEGASITKLPAIGIARPCSAFGNIF